MQRSQDAPENGLGEGVDTNGTDQSAQGRQPEQPEQPALASEVRPLDNFVRYSDIINADSDDDEEYDEEYDDEEEEDEDFDETDEDALEDEHVFYLAQGDER